MDQHQRRALGHRDEPGWVKSRIQQWEDTIRKTDSRYADATDEELTQHVQHLLDQHGHNRRHSDYSLMGFSYLPASPTQQERLSPRRHSSLVGYAPKMPMYEEGRMRSMELETPLEEDELEAENLEHDDERGANGEADGDFDSEDHNHKHDMYNDYIDGNNYLNHHQSDWYEKEHLGPHEGMDFDEDLEDNAAEKYVYITMVNASCDTKEVLFFLSSLS
ncbi:uncharacterized protein [Diadema setosum]|uniref:uncharacterized protein n=1 Tax=Diadema setosum TaxID=31175 RepID=UPI003B3AC0E8